jgi:hypothetical protein
MLYAHAAFPLATAVSAAAPAAAAAAAVSAAFAVAADASQPAAPAAAVQMPVEVSCPGHHPDLPPGANAMQDAQMLQLAAAQHHAAPG